MSNTWSIYWCAFYWSKPKWAIPEKIQTEVGWGHWNFRGYWWKSMWKFQGSIKKEVDYPGMFKTNSLWNFYRSCFLTLGLQVVLHNFAEYSGLWKLVFSGIIKGKVANLKIPGWFSVNYILNPPSSPRFDFCLE